MPTFIKLHTAGKYSQPILVNINQIISINPAPYTDGDEQKSGVGILVTYPEYGYNTYKESFEEVERIINGAQ